METINHKCYVSLEVAELLKQAGFNWYDCNYRYNSNLKLDYNIPGRIYGGDYHCAAPTLDVTQRWLREVKNVILLVNFNNDEDCEENERYGVTIYTGKERIIELATYPTYEEAQEAGIKKALEIVLEKGE